MAEPGEPGHLASNGKLTEDKILGRAKVSETKQSQLRRAEDRRRDLLERQARVAREYNELLTDKEVRGSSFGATNGLRRFIPSICLRFQLRLSLQEGLLENTRRSIRSLEAAVRVAFGGRPCIDCHDMLHRRCFLYRVFG